jgi:uncharacterized SAM-binding protein YcdF (DUF218 family)
MFFFASKVLWLVGAPVNLCVIGALAGIALMRWRPRGGRWIALVFLACLAIMTFSPLGQLLLRPLEQRFPGPPADMPAPYGIIVLGGAVDDGLSAAHGQVELQEGGSRLTEAALLARKYPQARVFYTGGDAFPMDGDSSEAIYGRELLIELGVDPVRIGIETRSRNTDENARFSAAILDPKPGQVWLVVTSAYHIPRAMGLFRKAGFDARAFPVDYRTYFDDRDYRTLLFRLTELDLTDLAVHEWVGLTAYYLTGKISDWFPAP